MRIILGVLAPSSGEVRWRGRAAENADRVRFGYMPEQRGLYPRMRVRDQLVFLARLHGMDAGAAGDAADRWLARLGLADRGRDRVEQLSHGNQQRVQLAAALVHDPVLLVHAEPFSGLDPLGVAALSEVLVERAAAGVPVVFSSHQLDLVEDLCDTVAVIDHGQLVLSGRLAQLKAAGGRVLVVEVSGGDDSWAKGVPSVHLLNGKSPDGRARPLLDEAGDPQAVLRAAQAAGPVLHFAFERPTLSELFRAAVAR